MILMVLRHAKAEKDSPTGKDFDRPLAAKGERQAEYIAEQLAKPRPPLAAPATIISSRAVRARSTAEIIGRALKQTVMFDDSLLPDAPRAGLMSLVRRVTRSDQPVLIVGHNPQFEDLVSHLSGEDDEMRTGELAALEIGSDAKGLTAKELARARLDDDD